MLHHADRLPGFIAYEDKTRLGLLTYKKHDNDCEIISLDSLESGKGVGSALVQSLISLVSGTECNRVWLITTNDNTDALCFYQKIGFELLVIHRNAVTKSRALKSLIPETGSNGIPIRDEIELQYTIKG